VASADADGDESKLNDRPLPPAGAVQPATANAPAKTDNSDTESATEAAVDAPTPADPVGSKDALIVQDP
jgi:hypothetical protein